MAKFNFPIAQSQPNWLQFQPEGAPGGSAAWKIDAQGSTPSILWIRSGMMQVEDCNVTADLVVDNSELIAADNQYEGITVIAALLSAGTSIPTRKWQNNVLGNPYDQWHHARDGWKRISRVLEFPDDHGGEELMLGIVVKASAGFTRVSSLSVVNSYERTYRATTVGSSNSITLLRREQVTVLRIGAGYTSYITETWDEAYLDTISVRIRKGEMVRQSAQAVISALLDSGIEIPTRAGIVIKYTASTGEEHFQDLIEFSSPGKTIPDTRLSNSSSFIAEYDFFQMEPILYVKTGLNLLGPTASAGHKGIKIQVTTHRNLFSS